MIVEKGRVVFLKITQNIFESFFMLFVRLRSRNLKDFCVAPGFHKRRRRTYRAGPFRERQHPGTNPRGEPFHLVTDPQHRRSMELLLTSSESD